MALRVLIAQLRLGLDTKLLSEEIAQPIKNRQHSLAFLRTARPQMATSVARGKLDVRSI